ncbi:hypothetical protein [Anaeromyxobacter paludicola]|uniref:Secreted protein n=1 Tax=Anaeromyxobacter paludicola TaxID=2918171 RepID=A0ABM7XE70_9BACT|nr:hypothetical protein [Anaeromyxobacter paludicola]BDG10193.1 hypothetical protein AMPC_33060 [Anaeromyxobacter paludicola]
MPELLEPVPVLSLVLLPPDEPMPPLVPPVEPVPAPPEPLPLPPPPPLCARAGALASSEIDAKTASARFRFFMILPSLVG